MTVNYLLIIETILKQYEDNNSKELNHFFNTMYFYVNEKNHMLFYANKIEFIDKNDMLRLIYPSLCYKKDLLINIYIKILKTYNALRRFVNLYRKSKFEIVIETDLLLNTIHSSSKNVLCIVQNNKIYLFYIFELLKIIYNSLSNSEFFFSEPLEIKNPYNNLKFEYHNLCNIYFFMKFNCIQFNDIFYRYFKCNFDHKIFLHRNFNYLRECNITNYVYNNNENNYLYIEIMNMINNYNNRIDKRYRILIHEDFPIDTLYNIMKKYLYLYINAWYSYIDYVTETFSKELNHRLFYFQKFNPQFGRLKYKIIKKYCFERKQIIMKTIKTFDDKHINFMCNLNMRFDGHYQYVKLHINYIRDNRNIKNDDDDMYYETNDENDDFENIIENNHREENGSVS